MAGSVVLFRMGRFWGKCGKAVAHAFELSNVGWGSRLHILEMRNCKSARRCAPALHAMFGAGASSSFVKRINHIKGNAWGGKRESVKRVHRRVIMSAWNL